MKQKELLQKIEEKPKDAGNQISLIKKITLNVILKLIRQLGAKMKYYYLNIILIFFFINTAHALDDDLTIPNSFSTGEVVSSSKINANFDAIETKVNKLNVGKSVFYPDGFRGTPILITTSTYTVPTGKTLYVTAYNVTTDYLVINDDSCHGNKWGKHASNLNQPLIVPAGNIVRNITMLNGFLVDVGVEAVVFILTSPNLSYTVPTGKYLTITLFYSGYPKNLLVDNIQISDSDIKDEASQERMPYLIPSGSIIKSEDDTRICVTGYLMSN